MIELNYTYTTTGWGGISNPNENQCEIESKIEIDFSTLDFDTDDLEQVASVQIARFSADDDLFDNMDDYSQETLEAAEIIFGSSKNAHFIREQLAFGSLFYLERITVNKKYRNQGIGKTIVTHLSDILENITFMADPVIVLTAGAIEVDRDDTLMREQTIQRLIKFYKRCGFQPIKKGSNVMFNKEDLEELF